MEALSPRSKKMYRYKEKKRQTDRQTGTRRFVDRIDDFDLFAKPVINFNMRGKDKVTTRCGLLFSFLLVAIVFYFALLRAL